MRDTDIQFLTTFLKDKSGLVITPDKTYLLENRLQPVVRTHSLESIDQLADLVRAGAREDLETAVVEAMTTNESFFFRDMTPFDNFRDVVLPYLIKTRAASKRIRLWSAAASTGQEPYSLAMLLKEVGGPISDWTIEILGTDLDTEVLNRARDGIYTQFEVQRGLPIQLLVKYFAQVGDKWQIDPSIRKMVNYRQHNLLNGAGLLGVFDVIFCRNVLIYFDNDTKKQVLDDMGRIMTPDGILFLGGAETVLGVTESFVPMPGVRGTYALKDADTGAICAPAAATG
ncbi:MAG: protein-glutamate O-methyltransferase CheR [Alphaproteobacteria bacterium]|nr:protein-glutamate O-methyltransferase CheR [Alphaproteobacteria bacterium]